MNQPLVTFFAVFTGCLATVSVDRFLLQDAAVASPSLLSAEAIEATLRRVDELESQVAKLRTQRDATPAEASATTARVLAQPVDDAAIDAAVERALAARGIARAASPAAETDKPLGAKERAIAMRGKSDFWSNSELYKRIFAEGKMDELVAAFEAAAEAAPNDTEAQMDVGNAYLAYLQLDNSKWPLSQKADQAFDRVLAIDETHWNARFTKAMSYTFWPDFLGKKKAAIAHFETLMTQQDTRPAQPHESNTYLILGNLLEQRGEAEKAKEVWRRGLKRHPNDAQLLQKIGG